jgi:hypothetical protein
MTLKVEFLKNKDFQTVRLFAILAGMTLVLVYLMKVVLFAPQANETTRRPADFSNTEASVVSQPKK